MRSHWLTALIAVWFVVPGSAAEPRHQAALAGHAGETCLAIAWTARSGERRTAAHVYELATNELSQPLDWDDLSAVAKRIRLSTGLARDSQPKRAVERLQQSLAAGPCLVSVGPVPQWSLAVDWDAKAKRIRLLDPARAAPGTVDLPLNSLVSLWQPRGGDYVWLPLSGRPLAPPRLTTHSRWEYRRKLDSLKRRTQGSEFTMLVQRPFVVIGDMTPRQTQRWAEGTVKWAVARMKAEYFSKNPDKILEIWLFDGKDSYEKHAVELFGRKPTTPYGYYSPRNGALVMNIRTGGGTLVHEILHPFMEANFPACPSWFNEGLASLYEQSGEVEGRIHGKTNWRLAGLQRAIQGGGVPAFKELCGTTSDQFYGDRSGVHYAQARYLCYYLQEQGKLAKFYHAFRANAAADPGGYATLRRVLGADDMADFQARWEKYVMALRFP